MSVPKTFQPTNVRRAVVAALGAAAVGTCLPAIAQTTQSQAPDDEPIEEIITTGTVLKRADTEALPISVMTSEDMELRGLNTISDVALRLPQNNAGTITNGWNVGFNFATGATAPALRGLTVQSTLSVADGLRLAPYPLADDGQRNFVDLNTIPNAIVERVEVLRDGASSTYGADAIAGVVNVITKKEIQGTHINMSAGFSQEGGGEEQRIDFSWGVGDLSSDGYNFYVAAEYMNEEALQRSDRDKPFGSADWQSICGPSGSCMPNYNWNGITQEDGSWNGWISDIPGIAYVRPVDAAGAGTAPYEFLNPAAGCRGFNEVPVPAGSNPIYPSISCEWDYWGITMLRPEIERMGLSTRFTKNFDNGAEFYAMANFYRTDTYSVFLPLNFDRDTRPPQGANYQNTYQALLPVYVCSQGVGSGIGDRATDALNTGCDATNGQLNPYNPYAAAGQRAEVEFRMPIENTRTTDSTSRVSRVAMGLNGILAQNWNYNVSYTFSEVNLTRTNTGDLIPQKVADVLAQGTYNLADPLATPADVISYMSPTIETVSPSRLWQIDGNIGREFFELPGGPLQAALGLSHRRESIDAPSGNPANDSAPYERFTGQNSVGTAGSRNVDSAYFEVLAPVLNSLEIVASGRYDDYSTGQDNFSPKVGFKFSPFDSLSLRASWSEGFRIPSFNEAFGLPTTGYVTRTVDCAQFADFCNAHDNNVYATGQYSLGLTQTGDPTLDPEESTSYTAGVIWNATDNLTITVDYWNIEVRNLITGVTDTSEAERQYYTNNGVVNIPGITVLPAPPDAAFPNALPLIGFIQSSYQNQDKQEVNGWDFSVTLAGIELGRFADWTSRFDASFLNEYTLTTDAGDALEYAGTLSPCNITSCSGSPEWRASWSNTFYFGEKTSATLTMYYTQGVDNASIDFGGVKGDCENNIGASVLTYVDGTTTDCVSDDIWNVDMTVQHQLNDKIRLFADVMNVFDIDPVVDVSAAYHLYGYNPAWSGPNIMGRYFRLGAKFDFE